MSIHLLIVDPQNSFCDPEGELFVTGADADMVRLADAVGRCGDAIRRITVTLDSHNTVHIAHPVWWRDREGNPPRPFTRMTGEEVSAGFWRAADPEDREWSVNYMKTVGAQVIWPYHCLMGTRGHAVAGPLLSRLMEWRERHPDLAFLVKGSCRFTEHFSAIRPCVSVPDDPSARVNHALIRELSRSDEIWVAGEASSHCVADTVTDLVELAPELASRIVLFTDAMSPVPGFEDRASDFFGRMRPAGVRTALVSDL